MRYLIGLVVEPVEKELNLRSLEGSTINAGGVHLGYGIDFDCPYWSYKVKALRFLSDGGKIKDFDYNDAIGDDSDFDYTKDEKEKMCLNSNYVLDDFMYNCKEMYVKVFDQRGLKHKLDNVCALVDLDNCFLGYILCNVPLIGCNNYMKCGDSNIDNYILNDDKELLYGCLTEDKIPLIKGKNCKFLPMNVDTREYVIVNLWHINYNLIDKDGSFGLR